MLVSLAAHSQLETHRAAKPLASIFPLTKGRIGKWIADCRDGDSSNVSACSLWHRLANGCHTPSPVPEPHGALQQGLVSSRSEGKERGLPAAGRARGSDPVHWLWDIWWLDSVGATLML